jgi:hypothetical protein
MALREDDCVCTMRNSVYQPLHLNPVLAKRPIPFDCHVPSVEGGTIYRNLGNQPPKFPKYS